MSSAHGVLEVVLDDHGHHGAAHGEGAGLHGLHRTGHAGMDGSGHETAGFTDLLTDGHLVAHRNDGLAGCTDVHRHGNDHLSRGCQLFDGLFIGCGLHIVGMNAAKESLCHCLHLILLPGWPYATTYCTLVYNKIAPLARPKLSFLSLFEYWRLGTPPFTHVCPCLSTFFRNIHLLPPAQFGCASCQMGRLYDKINTYIDILRHRPAGEKGHKTHDEPY